MKRILIVEDDKLTALALEALIKKMGYSSAGISNSGEQALRIVEQESLDLILMDITLSGDLSGLETAGRIAALKTIPLIFITGHDDIETLNQAKNVHPNGYIIKPIHGENDLRPSIELAFHQFENRRKIEEKIQKFDQIRQLVKSTEENFEISSQIGQKRANNEESKKTSSNQQTRNEIIISLIQWLDALSNYDRFLIINMIRNHPLKLNEIQDLLGKSQSTTSHHLKKLEEVNLIQGWKQGKFTHYSLKQDVIEDFLRKWDMWCSRGFENESPELTDLQIKLLQRVIEAIGNEDRFTIFDHLCEKGLSITELEKSLEKSQSTLSHHIKILHASEIIKGTKAGKFTEYEVNWDLFRQFNAILHQWLGGATNWA